MSLICVDNWVGKYVLGHHLLVNAHASKVYNNTYAVILGDKHVVVGITSCGGAHLALSLIPGSTDTMTYEVGFYQAFYVIYVSKLFVEFQIILLNA